MTGGRRWLFVAVVHFITFSSALHRQRSVEDTQEFSQSCITSGECRTEDNPCSVGWTNVKGACQPRCIKPCVHGVCVEPEKCLCHRGYQGRLCDEDVNECGLPERPCSQRCVNTYGSFRCYCEPGYGLRADGSTCTRQGSWSSLRCQFDVQMERGEAVGCLCPPGLQLASDNRTCEDVNECEREAGVCPPRQTCRNTFGSFICVCQAGFVLGTLGGAVECRDQDECLTGAHQCSPHAWCFNTDGSYTCQCVEGYVGNGHTCWPRRAPQTRPVMYFNYKLSKRTKRPPHHQGSN